MEDVLQSIIKEATGKQQQNLKNATQIAYGMDNIWIYSLPSNL